RGLRHRARALDADLAESARAVAAAAVGGVVEGVDAGVVADVRGRAEVGAGGAERAWITCVVARAAVTDIVREVCAHTRAEGFTREARFAGSTRCTRTGLRGGVARDDGIEVDLAATRGGAEQGAQRHERHSPMTPHHDTSAPKLGKMSSLPKRVTTSSAKRMDRSALVSAASNRKKSPAAAPSTVKTCRAEPTPSIASGRSTLSLRFSCGGPAGPSPSGGGGPAGPSPSGGGGPAGPGGRAWPSLEA